MEAVDKSKLLTKPARLMNPCPPDEKGGLQQAQAVAERPVAPDLRVFKIDSVTGLQQRINELRLACKLFEAEDICFDEDVILSRSVHSTRVASASKYAPRSFSEKNLSSNRVPSSTPAEANTSQGTKRRNTARAASTVLCMSEYRGCNHRASAFLILFISFNKTLRDHLPGSV
jgi:hypothetical protein